jgi:hypothetical protein
VLDVCGDTDIEQNPLQNVWGMGLRFDSSLHTGAGDIRLWIEVLCGILGNMGNMGLWGL